MKWRDHADEFADTLKIATIFSKYTLDRYGGHYYAKAQNLRRRLRAAYDAVLARYDLMLLPTTAMKATPIPAKGATPQEITRRSWEAHAQHLPVQRHRPSGDQYSLRHGGRPAGRADAGRPALGRAHDLSRQRGVRGVRRLDEVFLVVPLAFFTLPWRGRVGCRAKRRQSGWGGKCMSAKQRKAHPTPLANARAPPPHFPPPPPRFRYYLFFHGI